MDKIPPIMFESPIKTCAGSLLAVSSTYFVARGLQKLFKRSERHPYPPGPPREFLLGAMRSFPKGFPLEGFNQWARTYGMQADSDLMTLDKLINNRHSGDIVYAPIPGMDIVILNSQEIAQELLAKRPSSTGGRRFGYLLTRL